MTFGNPDLHVPYTGTSSAEPLPLPPPAGYTLDQWIAERKIRADRELAAAQQRLADELFRDRLVAPDLNDLHTVRRLAQPRPAPDDGDHRFAIAMLALGSALLLILAISALVLR